MKIIRKRYLFVRCNTDVFQTFKDKLFFPASLCLFIKCFFLFCFFFIYVLPLLYFFIRTGVKDLESETSRE